MTPLNTIIEEEKKRFDKQYTHGGEWWKEGMVITPMMVKSFLTTAMQRAYEAGEKKTRESLLEEIKAFTFEACPYEGTIMRAFIRSKHSELDQPNK